jgi:transcriptional regulator of arginine metabolism
MVVIHTPSGAASYVASAIDRSGTSSIIGTVAGSDTVMAVTRALDGGAVVAAELRALMKEAVEEIHSDT